MSNKQQPNAMEAAAPQPERLYIAVRQDIPVGLQMAQAVHAGFSFAQQHPKRTGRWMRDSQFVIIVAVPDETHLRGLAQQAAAARVRHVLWCEPDLGDCATALALEPGEAARTLCRRLPLAGDSASPALLPDESITLDGSPPGGWGLQHLEHYSDWPEWFDYSSGAEPLRFPAREEAEAYLHSMLTTEYDQQQRRWELAQEEARQVRDLAARRQAALEAAGLWDSPVDRGMHPLLRHVTLGAHEPVPVEKVQEKWRVVPDAEMDEPVVPPGVLSRCLVCGRGEQ